MMDLTVYDSPKQHSAASLIATDQTVDLSKQLSEIEKNLGELGKKNLDSAGEEEFLALKLKKIEIIKQMRAAFIASAPAKALDAADVERELRFIDDEDNFEHFLPSKGKYQKTTTDTYGCVVYVDADYYCRNLSLTPEALNLTNQGIHIPYSASDVIKAVKNYIESKHPVEVKQIIAGHEHGAKNGKCHYQIIVYLKTKAKITIKPAQFNLNGCPAEGGIGGTPNLLFMAQRAKNAYALKQYCMKDGQFTYLNPELAVKPVYKLNKNGEATNKIDCWATVYQNRALLGSEEAKDMILNGEPRTGITMFKNIEYALTSLIKEDVPEFAWNFPEHIKNSAESRMQLITKWFFKYCQPENMDRRKGLMIYGVRGCGKSRFAESLVNHPKYLVSSSGVFNGKDVEQKDPKLLVLDDMNHYTKDNKECWKRLVVGQTTNIRDAYVNLSWKYKVPCIILTNNKQMFKNFALDSDFKTQVMLVDLSDGFYMGPPGSKPQEIDSIEHEILPETQKYIDEEVLKRENFEQNNFVGKKTGRGDFDDFRKLNNQITELSDTLEDRNQYIKNLEAQIAQMNRLFHQKKLELEDLKRAAGN